MDSERHKNLLFETKEFAVMITNLPKMRSDADLLQMKADLWDHITRIVKEQK